MDVDTAGGDIEKFRDELLAMCDKLSEEDIVRHLRYNIEMLSKSAIEQISEQTRIHMMLLADFEKLQLKETVMIKSEPASPSVMELGTSTQVTARSKPLILSSYLHPIALFIHTCTSWVKLKLLWKAF